MLDWLPQMPKYRQLLRLRLLSIAAIGVKLFAGAVVRSMIETRCTIKKIYRFRSDASTNKAQVSLKKIIVTGLQKVAKHCRHVRVDAARFPGGARSLEKRAVVGA